MEKIARSLAGLHLPRYQELPQMGLYLEQTATYINEALGPLGKRPPDQFHGQQLCQA